MFLYGFVLYFTRLVSLLLMHAHSASAKLANRETRARTMISRDGNRHHFCFWWYRLSLSASATVYALRHEIPKLFTDDVDVHLATTRALRVSSAMMVWEKAMAFAFKTLTDHYQYEKTIVS
jgi:hypothetical protein